MATGARVYLLIEQIHHIRERKEEEGFQILRVSPWEERKGDEEMESRRVGVGNGEERRREGEVFVKGEVDGDVLLHRSKYNLLKRIGRGRTGEG